VSSRFAIYTIGLPLQPYAAVYSMSTRFVFISAQMRLLDDAVMEQKIIGRGLVGEDDNTAEREES
jgi:hypothetical protein